MRLLLPLSWLLFSCFWEEVLCSSGPPDSPGAVTWIFVLFGVSLAMLVGGSAWFSFKHPDAVRYLCSCPCSVPSFMVGGVRRKKPEVRQAKANPFAEEDLEEPHCVREMAGHALRSAGAVDEENPSDEYPREAWAAHHGIDVDADINADIDADIAAALKSKSYTRQLSGQSTASGVTSNAGRSGRRPAGLKIQTSEGFGRQNTQEQEAEISKTFFGDAPLSPTTPLGGRGKSRSPRSSRSTSPGVFSVKKDRPLAAQADAHREAKARDKSASPSPRQLPPPQTASPRSHAPRDGRSTSPRPQASSSPRSPAVPAGGGPHATARRPSVSSTAPASPLSPASPFDQGRPPRRPSVSSQGPGQGSPESASRRPSVSSTQVQGRRPSVSPPPESGARTRDPLSGTWSGTMKEAGGGGIQNPEKYSLNFSKGKITGSRSGATIEGSFKLCHHGATCTWIESHVEGFVKVSARLDDYTGDSQGVWRLAGEFSGSQHGHGTLALCSPKK
ncbi:unnamed protein product [Polarella glacialis]|uniref:Uncharacterized protein n=1 Tax=Polarella glacialis TaxID=89957 RepID=A0A813DCB9_POLGL|nr:unnamed protein product [Polarella glacialis]CAE8597273.1 unnamed protein product [Polarella glacialis]CAE8656944.1 unnamed protein product [Polarella glacialis]